MAIFMGLGFRPQAKNTWCVDRVQATMMMVSDQGNNAMQKWW